MLELIKVMSMRLIFDDEYENVDSSLRSFDDDKYCLFIDEAGYNESKSIIESHWHEWLEIVHIIDGAMETLTPHGCFRVDSGNVIVVGMQSLHKMIGQEGHFRFRCLHLNIGFILQYLPTSILADKVFLVENKEEFLKIFANIISRMQHNDVISQLEYKSSLLSLLALCLKESQVDFAGKNNKRDDTFSKILFYVSSHYREDISLQHLSHEFDYTTQYISLMFKQYLNTNYYSYLIKLRLDRAKFLMMTSDKRVIDIALECGFASEHSFINHFKKWYSLTPSQYRKKDKK